MHWIGNYDATLGRIPITDEMISEAQPFDGWHPNFLDWTECERPCIQPCKNAYHIQQLAKLMLRQRHWIGDPLIIYHGTEKVFDGSHRLRAAQYVKMQYGINIDVPYRYAATWVKDLRR